MCLGSVDIEIESCGAVEISHYVICRGIYYDTLAWLGLRHKPLSEIAGSTNILIQIIGGFLPSL